METMTWDAIIKSYPNEWVALVNADESTEGVQSGVVVAHAHDRQKFHTLAQSLIQKHQDLSIAYTGQLVTSTELPFLWQISHIDPSIA